MGWFDLGEVRGQAAAVADEYARVRTSGAAMAVKQERQARRHERPAARAIAFMSGLGLNLYKKGRFLQFLRAELAQRGVPDAEAEAFARDVMTGPLAAARRTPR